MHDRIVILATVDIEQEVISRNWFVVEELKKDCPKVISVEVQVVVHADEGVCRDRIGAKHPQSDKDPRKRKYSLSFHQPVPKSICPSPEIN
jgi:hypothetical protein